MSKWTKSIIINEIKELHSAGESLEAGTIIENHHQLYAAAYRYFGNWYKAVEAASINPHSIIKKTNKSKKRSESIKIQVERIFKTIYYISNYPETTSRMLAELIGVSPRTIQRYVRTLRKVPGVDVRYIDKYNGYDIFLEGTKKEEDAYKYIHIWSKRENKLLEYLIAKGESVEKISELLERPVDVIEKRIQKMKLSQG